MTPDSCLQWGMCGAGTKESHLPVHGSLRERTAGDRGDREEDAVEIQGLRIPPGNSAFLRRDQSLSMEKNRAGFFKGLSQTVFNF